MMTTTTKVRDERVTWTRKLNRSESGRAACIICSKYLRLPPRTAVEIKDIRDAEQLARAYCITCYQPHQSAVGGLVGRYISGISQAQITSS